MEPIGATASILGIASFGLGLAKSLQAFIDSVIEAEETIILIVAEVNSTASTLRDLQDFIDRDRAASKEEHRATVFSTTGIKEVSTCALQCQRIYVQIIILIEKASMQVGEDGSKDAGPQSPAAADLNTRLAVFNKHITKLGRKMRWPWLEPRIKRCQEHLGRLKASLMLRLLVVSIAQTRVRPSVAIILGTDDENEMRRRAEALRKKMTEMRTKTRPAKQPTRQPPGSDNGASAEADATSNTSASSTTSVDTTSSSQSPPVSPGLDNGASAEADATRNTSATFTTSVDTTSSSQSLPVSPASSSSSSLMSNPLPGSRRARRVRVSRARRILSAFVHIWKRTERTSVFKKDSKSVIFEAYLIYPIPGPFSGNSYPPPIKLPFGHRRLTREIKHALRKFNPWDILLILSPHHRYLVDRVVQRVQHAAAGTSHVCLVAIDVDGSVDVDGYSDDNISALEAGDLVWTRMVLFFRHEPVQARQGTTEAEIDSIGGRPRFGTSGRNVFLGAGWKSRKHLELQEKRKRKQEEETRAVEEKQQQELEEKAKAEMAKRDAEARAKEEKQQQELKEKAKAEMAKRDAETREHTRKLEIKREEQRRSEIAQEHMRRQRKREYRRRQRENYIRAEVSRRLQMLDEDRLREERRGQEEEDEALRVEQELKDRVEAEVMKRDAAKRLHEEMEHRRQQEQKEHDRMVANEAMYKLLAMQRREKEGGEDQASKKPEAFLEDVEKAIREREPKISEEERTKKILEEKRAEMKAREEKAAAEKAKSPITFTDATGRNFSFPFHLVQTWKGMEDLIKEALLHMERIYPHVKEGHYDLERSEGQIILPSLWSATIKPGDSVVMRMWTVKEALGSPQPAPPLPGSLTQGVPPLSVPGTSQVFSPSPRPADLLYPAPTSGEMPSRPEALQQARTNVEASQRALGLQHDDDEERSAIEIEDGNLREQFSREQQAKIQAEVDRMWQERVNMQAEQEDEARRRNYDVRRGEDDTRQGGYEGRHSHDEAHRRAYEAHRPGKIVRFSRSTKPSERDGKGKHKHVNLKTVRDPENSDEGDDMSDIDKELGLDDLEGADEMFAKDVDELLGTWTNVAGDT